MFTDYMEFNYRFQLSDYSLQWVKMEQNWQLQMLTKVVWTIKEYNENGKKYKCQ